jgi:predicted enzyme related to lactoylglutathione lyase
MDRRMCAVRVFTTRWDDAVPFYRDTLGWPLRLLDQARGWAQFELGGSHVFLERISSDTPSANALVGRFTGITIAVSDIQASYGHLQRCGVVFDGAPEQQPWGGVVAHFEDPDGNVLTLLGAT